MITPGYRIVLQTAAAELAYRTDQQGAFRRETMGIRSHGASFAADLGVSHEPIRAALQPRATCRSQRARLLTPRQKVAIRKLRDVK